ncbi:hypothetical protein TWF694_005170 [Orbilia ellipsospora]|uniref:Rhodopsin domain-containing protein n=1 Tax=Orbilia ellipsospora TaxID=2528407 RepID=A0AAV9WUT0_9PEZI
MSSSLSEDDIFYLTLTCYYWGSSSQYFVNQPTNEALKALAQFYATNPSADDDQVASYFGWDTKTYSVMEENFGPFNETVSVVDLLPLAPHPRATGSIIPLFVVFTILSTLVIALRLWSRLSLLGRIQSFDWIALLSYLLIVAWGAYGVHASVVGGDMASWCDRSYHQIKQQSIAYNIGMTTYPAVVLSIKISLLVFYYQLSTWRALRVAVWITAFISIGNAFGGFLAFLLQCNRVNFWDYEFDLGLVCRVNTLKAILGTGIVNVITDALIWVIPMPLVWRLQLYPRERIIAIFTFGLGGIACIAGAIRLKAVEDSIRFGVNGKDSVLPIIAWGIVELNLGLICSSAPALRALVMRHIPKILSYGSGNSSADMKGSAAGGRVHAVRNSANSGQSPVGMAASREKFTKSPDIGYAEYEKPDTPTSTTTMELPIQRGSKAVSLV